MEQDSWNWQKTKCSIQRKRIIVKIGRLISENGVVSLNRDNSVFLAFSHSCQAVDFLEVGFVGS